MYDNLETLQLGLDEFELLSFFDCRIQELLGLTSTFYGCYTHVGKS
jgi:hypothetical protein